MCEFLVGVLVAALPPGGGETPHDQLLEEHEWRQQGSCGKQNMTTSAGEINPTNNVIPDIVRSTLLMLPSFLTVNEVLK